MRQQITATATTPRQITQSVTQCLGRLQQKRQFDEAAQQDFATVRSLLETVPLATNEFDPACRRLENALHYLKYTEPGAAWYELRMVAGSLQRVEPQTREPNRQRKRQAS